MKTKEIANIRRRLERLRAKPKQTPARRRTIAELEDKLRAAGIKDVGN